MSIAESRRRSKNARLLDLHIAGLVGGSVAAAWWVSKTRWPVLHAHPDQVGLIAVLVVVAELLPVRLARIDFPGAVDTSAAFALALLLGAGAGPAIAAQALATALTGLLRRIPPRANVLDLGRQTCALAVAALAAGAVAHPAPMASGHAVANDFPAIALAFAGYHFTNQILGHLRWRLETPRAARQLRSTRPVFELVTSLVILGIAPLVVVLAWNDLMLTPLILLPVGAVYWSARSSLDRAHEASHDALTGLANRVEFRRGAVEALADASRRNSQLAVLLIDLDRFKDINDTLGHHIGDELLKGVGPRLAEVGEKVAMVARLGGDEFAVLLSPIADSAEALDIAHELVKALQMPFEVADLQLDVDASVGVACFPEHGADVDGLLQRADVAMYVAKAAHGGAELYDDNRNVNTHRRFALMRQLRSAIANGEVVLYYQPKVDLAAGRITGVEALARWDHPELGPIPPAEFISIAEHTGAIHTLTQYLLRTGIEQAAAWHRMGTNLRMAVNLSPSFLHDATLPSHIGRLLTLLDLPAHKLELEITESTLMSDPDTAKRVLADLAQMGVRVSIDDFGTGYSSLALLKELPVTEVKIDKSFIPDEGNMTDDILVRSIIDLARNLGLETTAEGIENHEQLEHLTKLGCTYGQGYLLGRPVPATEATRRLVTLGVSPISLAV